MSPTPPEPDEADALAVHQIAEVDLNAIGEALTTLADQLRDAGRSLYGRTLLDPSKSYWHDEDREMTSDEVGLHNHETYRAFRATLRSMRAFRRQYDRWERLAAEYALTQMSYSQREAAEELGVAASTINRWAQHPLKVEDYR